MGFSRAEAVGMAKAGRARHTPGLGSTRRAWAWLRPARTSERTRIKTDTDKAPRFGSWTKQAYGSYFGEWGGPGPIQPSSARSHICPHTADHSITPHTHVHPSPGNERALSARFRPGLLLILLSMTPCPDAFKPVSDSCAGPTAKAVGGRTPGRSVWDLR